MLLGQYDLSRENIGGVRESNFLSVLFCENIRGDGESNLNIPPNLSSDIMLKTGPSKILRC